MEKIINEKLKYISTENENYVLERNSGRDSLNLYRKILT